MKKLLFTLLTVAIATSVHAQSLTSEARGLKQKYPDAYNVILQHAKDEWNNDYRMVVYTINQHVDSMIGLFKGTGKNTSTRESKIILKCMLKWAYDGYEDNILNKIKSGNPKMMQFHVDWRMVKYCYDNQIQAYKALK